MAIVGSLVSTAGRPVVEAGPHVWVITVVGGLLLRVVSGGDAPIAFILVTTAVLALLLIGWRALLRKQIEAPRTARWRFPTTALM